MMTSKEIRQSFLDFFASKNHTVVPSAPMVIKDDPTLMFTNAGMNQFKNVILGNDPIVYPRVADAQKCLRVSGKHNDLEEVGHDTYHHTMFEMLGNWSFGNYFKQEAIAWAWEYLTDVLGLDKERFYVTVFEGSDGLERDNEASDIWEQYVDRARILNGSKKDNFWEMGDTGPCGPCSEIHIDLRSDLERQQVDGASLVNHDHPQVIEIWNLVFMQYNRTSDGSLQPLPNRVIDTGMGFERLCMAVQKRQSNYDTDVFQPLIGKIGELCACRYGEAPKQDVAMRVVADHIRTVAFAITDGQLPSNAKAGYVIRRILRRAVRYGYTFMNRRTAFMYKLIPTLTENMGDAYPELLHQQTLIERVIKEEEEAFLRTLETGIRLLDKVITDAKNNQSSHISGNEAFILYDTYGFPLDLTELIIREHGLSVDVAAFNDEMLKQKERARNAAAVETGDWVVISQGTTTFVGYDTLETPAQVLRYRKMVQKNKTFYQLVLSETPFYAEMGGQTGDAGKLITDAETVDVIDTKRENNLSVHITERLPQDVHATFRAVVDGKRRKATEANHTATHLLHEALREVLGTHVEQKGSFVSHLILRFDFSHYQKITHEEIRRVEHLVNSRIRANQPRCEQRNVPIDRAGQMGAIALFGEKYGDTVRVIQYGSSIELCGGTHVQATGEIGLFKIVSESSIAAGIRRIEAVTAENAETFINALQDLHASLLQFFNNTPDVLSAVKKLFEESTQFRKKIEELLQERAKELQEQLLQHAETINGVQVIRHTVRHESPELFKLMAPFFKERFINDKFMFIGCSEENGKPSIMVFISQAMVEAGFNAGVMVREAAKEIRGGGGGQPFMATAGGSYPQGLQAAVKKLLSFIE
ncbi:MAG: alanine--tRNA ligase [Prevotellaceae bacterium]|jgi:alanyl-tRNA synthetase|nr:alanine--tRNA ligase [Prevotellaceae bacterium]